MAKSVKPNQLGDAISKDLSIYNERVTERIKVEARKSVKDLVAKTKATAPVGNRRKHYKNSISSQEFENKRSITCMWYVKGSDYRLSHLLENGHATRNGGRVAGTHFIKNASDPILRQFEKAVEEIIKND